jgi:hypothetical protein
MRMNSTEMIANANNTLPRFTLLMSPYSKCQVGFARQLGFERLGE